MVSVCVVVHRLELFVNNPNTSFMRPICDTSDILGAFAHFVELFLDSFRRLNSGLGMEFG